MCLETSTMKTIGSGQKSFEKLYSFLSCRERRKEFKICLKSTSSILNLAQLSIKMFQGSVLPSRIEQRNQLSCLKRR